MGVWSTRLAMCNSWAGLNWAMWATRACGNIGPGREIHTAKAILGLVGHMHMWAHIGMQHRSWTHFHCLTAKVSRVTRVDCGPTVGSASLPRPLIDWNDCMTDTIMHVIKHDDVPLVWYCMPWFYAWYYVLACHICILHCIGVGLYCSEEVYWKALSLNYWQLSYKLLSSAAFSTFWSVRMGRLIISPHGV